MVGIILKGVGSFYTVLAEDNTEYICKARGKFRKDGLTPVPGDKVEFEVQNDGNGYILSIFDRKNSLIRPMIANIDNLLIVVSASLPKPDFMLIDKLIIKCELSAMRPIIVVNKYDEKDDEVFSEILENYLLSGYKIIKTSTLSSYGQEELKQVLKNKTSCLAGQSAVGKSSIMNMIYPNLNLKVGDLSAKTDRGKHTTRHAQLWQLEYGGAILDTPGFSLMDIEEIEPEKLSELYPEMKKWIGSCRFPGCLHISEPDCEVKKHIINDCGMSKTRYERYITLIQELKEKRKHKYD